MAGTAISIKVRAELVKGNLQKIADGVAETTAINRLVALRILKLIQKGFRQESVPGTGKKWTELKPATLARKTGKTEKAQKRRKKRIRGSPKILQDSGDLRKSFSIEGTGPRTIIVGTETEYAGVHQHGWAKKNIPARPMLPPDAVTGDIGLRILNVQMQKLIRGAS